MALFGVSHLGNRAKSVQECFIILISLVAPYAPKVPTLRKNYLWEHLSITLYLLVLSADNFCKQIGIQTVWHSDSIIDRIFHKSWFWEKSADDKISMKNYPACKELSNMYMLWLLEVTITLKHPKHIICLICKIRKRKKITKKICLSCLMGIVLNRKWNIQVWDWNRPKRNHYLSDKTLSIFLSILTSTKNASLIITDF